MGNDIQYWKTEKQLAKEVLQIVLIATAIGAAISLAAGLIIAWGPW